MALTYGSLFSGIGGLDMALEACDWSPAWQVENDPFCGKILERHWPDVRRYGDIREVDWQGVERVELVCGGFPCQPFSVAGQNRGVDDERNMWPETIRAVRELGPCYVFLENVPGLLAHGYFGTILGDLAEGGYDAVWDTFTAAEVGASHRRERLFLLAWLGNSKRSPIWFKDTDGRQPEGVPESAGGTLAHSAINIRRTLRDDGREPPDGPSDRDVADADTVGLQRSSAIRELGGERLGFSRFPPGPDDRDAWARVLTEVPALEPAVCRMATGVPDRTHRLRVLGNAVVPAQGAYALRTLWRKMMAL